jgi:hypothetical protein
MAFAIDSFYRYGHQTKLMNFIFTALIISYEKDFYFWIV